MDDLKFKALTLEYRAFRAVALWFDVGTTIGAILGWVALALSLTGHDAWCVITAVLSILLCLRFQTGLNEKFNIIRECVRDMLNIVNDGEASQIFRHDRNMHNEGARRFADGLFFGTSYLAAIAAIVLAAVL